MIELSSRNSKILSELPQEESTFFKWFLALTEIPHPTHLCDKIFSNVNEWIHKLGFETDLSTKNIIVRIPSNRQNNCSTTIAIEAHLDMVSVGEFFDGKIEVDFDGENLFAPKSTLGADDGFGVSVILDLIQHEKEIAHPNLELILTTDEETTMEGIRSILPPPFFKFQYLINLDSLSSESIFVGSMGCHQHSFVFEPKFEGHSGFCVEFLINGLLGGHSGMCMKYGRGNAIKWGIHILNVLKQNQINFKITTINGGEKLNSIPSSFNAKLIVNQLEKAVRLIKSTYDSLKSMFKKIENPNFEIQVTNQPIETEVLETNISTKILDLATILHNGPIKESKEFPGVYESLQCVVLLRVNQNECSVSANSRALFNSDQSDFHHQQEAYCRILGCSLKTIGMVWPWVPKSELNFAIECQQIHEKVFEEPINLSVLNVTIETSILCEKGYNDCEMISICPSIPKAHSIGEYMNVHEAMKKKQVILKLLEQYSN